MSTLFGGMNKSRDIKDIVEKLREGGDAMINESAGKEVSQIEVENMADEIKSVMLEHYSNLFQDPRFDNMLEDAESVAQIFKNNLLENQSTLSESASMPSLVTLTASIATTMRTPYEAVLHRLFDTRTLDKQIVEIETVTPTIKAYEDEEEERGDALAPYAKVPFVDRTEIEVETLVNGLEPGSGCKDLPLLVGKNPLYRVNRDVRISKIEAEVAGEVIPADKIHMSKGAVPYFDAKDNVLSCMFDLETAAGEIVHAGVDAKIDFTRSVMIYLRADDCVKKVYFYATVDHAEHTHPIHTSFRNNFQQFLAPTPPHI